MKKELKGFVCGVLITSIVGIGVVSASGIWDNISVLRNDINVVVNGNIVNSDNFLYQDTTYLPLRAVSTALGENVEYDEQTNTAYIGERKDNLNNNTEKIFEGKYNPDDYKDIFNKLNMNAKKDVMELVDNQYYIEERECRKLLERYNLLDEDIYDENTMKNTYVIDGISKTFDIVMIGSGGYILFDTFVEEILPLVDIDPNSVVE